MYIKINKELSRKNGFVFNEEELEDIYELVSKNKYNFYIIKNKQTKKEYLLPKKIIKPILELSEIPYDFEEMLEEDNEIMLSNNVSKNFEEVMMFYEFMDYGSCRRSARVITEKCKKLTSNEVKVVILNKKINEIEEEIKGNSENTELKILFELSKKYNYRLVKNK